MNMLQARDFYTELGIDAIPLCPDDGKGEENGKHPIHINGWQTKEPRRLWAMAPNNANVGLRGGGEIGAAFLDCDDKNKAGTFENVTAFLHGLGVTEYPLIKTASQVGRHIYLTVTDAPQGNYCNLAKATGAGEFRYGAGAFIVAAPSVVDGRYYEILSGDFSHIPQVAFDDLRPILGETVNDWQPSPTVPRNAFAILNGNAEAIAKFDNDRSRAEQALLLSLANKDFTFPDILQLFNKYPCAGKYAELRNINSQNAERYLAHSFARAQADAQKDSKKRQTVLRAIAWANDRVWTGTGGAGEQAVFLAHMTIAYKAGTVTGWAADKRTLANLAGVSEASKVNKRLLLAGWIKLERHSTVDCANIYSLSTTLPLPKNLECVEVVTLCSDAFRKTSRLSIQGKHLTSGFGTIGRQLWVALKSNPMDDHELANFTGRDIRTVRKYLENMRTVVDQKTGEVLPMVELVPTAEGEKWRILDVNLDAVALAIGTYGKGHKQIQEHAKERRMHSKSLMAGKSR